MKLVPLAALALLAVAGCADAPTAIRAPQDGPSLVTVQWVSVSCPAVMYVNDFGSCSATAYDSVGGTVYGSVSWSSSNPMAVSVSNGNVWAYEPGSATITAYIGGKSGQATINVNYIPQVTYATISPSPSTVYKGYTRQLTATAYDQYGYPMGGVPFTWSSSNTGVATVSSSGLVSGVNTGSATIYAYASGATASASVTVSNAPLTASASGPWSATRYQSVQISASASGGTPGYTYQWRSRQGNAYSWGAWQSYYSTGSTNYTYASTSSCGIDRNQIEVKVTDANGATATSSHTVSISNPC